MKPHPRIRKCVKWGGAVACVLLVAAWVGSGWWMVGWWYAGWKPVVCNGQISIGHYGMPGFRSPGHFALHSAPYGDRFKWWFHVGRTPNAWEIGVPFWVLLGPTLLLTSAAWHRDAVARRRALAWACPKCHYNRTGLAPGAVCPECGAAEKPAADQRG